MIEARASKTIRSGGIAYRALVTLATDDGGAFTGDADVEAQKSVKGNWVQIALGMFGVGGLDFGDDWKNIPESVQERFQDVVESVVQAAVNEEDDSEEDDED